MGAHKFIPVLLDIFLGVVVATALYPMITSAITSFNATVNNTLSNVMAGNAGIIAVIFTVAVFAVVVYGLMSLIGKKGK